MFPPKWKEEKITRYLHSDHNRDKAVCRSVKGIVILYSHCLYCIIIWCNPNFFINNEHCERAKRASSEFLVDKLVWKVQVGKIESGVICAPSTVRRPSYGLNLKNGLTDFHEILNICRPNTENVHKIVHFWKFQNLTFF